MSFTEIIHWVALTTTLIVGAVYTWLAWGATTTDQLTGALVVAMIVLVAALVVIAIAMAIRSDGRLADERDDAIESGALPYTFSTMVVGTMWAVSDILTRNVPDDVRTANILLGTVFTAICVGSAVTLLRYRRGIR